MPDLKNCPFCGSDAEGRRQDIPDGPASIPGYAICCTNRKCHGQVSADELWDSLARKEGLPSIAAGKWNKRYPTAWCECGDSHTNESVCANCLMVETAQPEGMVSVPAEVWQQALNAWSAYTVGDMDACASSLGDMDRKMAALERGEG